MDTGLEVPVRPLLKPPAQDDETGELRSQADLTHAAEAAVARLQLVHDQIDAMANDDSENRLQALKAVLERHEFQRTMTLRARFLEWLRSLLERILPEGSEAGGNSLLGPFFFQLIGWTAIFLAAGVIAYLLSYWLRNFLVGFVRDTEVNRQLYPDGIPLTSAEAHAQATVLAQAGSFRQAVRHLYLAALLRLEEQGALKYDRSLTNREVLESVTGQQDVQAQLEPVIETFDEVWYGIHEPDQETFDRYEQRIDKLKNVPLQSAEGQHRQGRSAA
jgi:hypothetical protein